MKKKVGILSKLNCMVAKIFGLYQKPDSIEGFKQLCRNMRDDKIISQNHLNKITKVLDLESIRVRDVMIPRPNMVNIQIGSSIKDIKNLVKKSGHSRFPVIDQENKKILGVIVIKDLLMSQERKSIKEFIREILFIPENRRLNSLLNDFQKKHQHCNMSAIKFTEPTDVVQIRCIWCNYV